MNPAGDDGGKGTGREGELLAREYLEELGFEIVEMNYRYGHGEIDIVAREGAVLVFCEVKMRKNDRFGPPEYAITPRKQRQIRRIAEGYFFDHEIREQETRFDVVAIRMRGQECELHHIRNAF